MITGRDLNPKGYKLTNSQLKNLEELCRVLNEFVGYLGFIPPITSGVRSMEHHINVYRQRAANQGIPFDMSKVPLKSNHLMGLAVDFYDPIDEIKQFIMDNLSLCESLGLYFEDFKYTPNWVHIQIVPPKSGKRFFIP